MNKEMRAMVLERPGAPLQQRLLPVPVPMADQVLIRVEACGVCRTDLHLMDGELPDPSLPVIPGHEIVGRIAALGSASCAGELSVGQRVGVPWLGHTCGCCAYCKEGRENLCDAARFTGYQLQGGYAEYAVADRRFCFPLPEAGNAVSLAPLLCAGLIGYRALVMAGTAPQLGIYGFGAAAHIIAQVAIAQGAHVYAFTRTGDEASQAFARELGVAWAGCSDDPPPRVLDAALIFAPVGALLPKALSVVRKGGVVICAGIHMSDIPAFPYRLLWGERQVRSVANLTRQDGISFFELLRRVPVTTNTTAFPLSEANSALEQLRQGKLQGAAVLVP